MPAAKLPRIVVIGDLNAAYDALVVLPKLR